MPRQRGSEIRREVAGLIRRWRELGVGEAMELEFRLVAERTA